MAVACTAFTLAFWTTQHAGLLPRLCQPIGHKRRAKWSGSSAI